MEKFNMPSFQSANVFIFCVKSNAMSKYFAKAIC
jgi:hypothetical protein